LHDELGVRRGHLEVGHDVAEVVVVTAQVGGLRDDPHLGGVDTLERQWPRDDVRQPVAVRDRGVVRVRRAVSDAVPHEPLPEKPRERGAGPTATWTSATASATRMSWSTVALANRAKLG